MSRSALALAALACLALATAPRAQWAFELSSDGSTPTARHEAAYVEFDGDFYLMGGRGPRPVDRYDPLAQEWTDLGNPPLQMHHFQPVVHDGKVWVLCAFKGNYPDETPVANIWTYDPALNTWAMGPAIPAARNRGAAAAVALDGMIYVIGGNTMGHNGGWVPWLDRYDPLTDTWTALEDAPHARDHFTAVAVGQRLVAAGGRRTEQPNPFLNTVAAVDVYDVSTAGWSNMPAPIPTERAGTMTVARDEHVIVIGGESSAGAHAECEALDLNTGEWTTLPALLDSRHSGGAVLQGELVYVASGSGNAGGSPELDTQERLDLGGLLGTSPSNLLPNGDLDDGLTGWQDQGDLVLHAEGNIAAPSLDVANGWAGLGVPVVAADTYTLSGAYQLLGTTGPATVAMDYLDGSFTKLGETSLAVAPSGAGFTSFTLSGLTPAGTAGIRVRVEAGGDRTLRVDDLVLRDTPAEVPVLGVPANPWALEPSSAGPVIGALYDPAIDHSDFAPTATLDVLILGFFPINVAGGPGTLLVDLGVSFLLFLPPGTRLNLHLPLDPALVGVPFLLQGASITPTGKQLTNALAVTVQGP